jgi:hypothetical protein
LGLFASTSVTQRGDGKNDKTLRNVFVVVKSEKKMGTLGKMDGVKWGKQWQNERDKYTSGREQGQKQQPRDPWPMAMGE